jgi:hypothetical protein
MGQRMTALRAWWAIRPWRRRPAPYSTAVANFPLPPEPERQPVVIAACPRCGYTHTRGYWYCDGLRVLGRAFDSQGFRPSWEQDDHHRTGDTDGSRDT